jgi:hypothetical protein
MGRKSIGEKAMDAAERQRRRRERLGIGGPWFKARRPWDGTLSDNRRESETIDAIEHWLQYGDNNTVTQWLVFNLSGRDDADALVKGLVPALREYEEQ